MVTNKDYIRSGELYDDPYWNIQYKCDIYFCGRNTLDLSYEFSEKFNCMVMKWRQEEQE